MDYYTSHLLTHWSFSSVVLLRGSGGRGTPPPWTTLLCRALQGEFSTDCLLLALNIQLAYEPHHSFAFLNVQPHKFRIGFNEKRLLEEFRCLCFSTLLSWAVAIDFNGINIHDFFVSFSSSFLGVFINIPTCFHSNQVRWLCLF